MIQLEFDFCDLPLSDHSVEQAFLSINDIENGVYNAKNYANFFDDDGTDEDDYDEQCRLTYDADSSFEQDIIDEKRKEKEDVTE